MKKGLHNASVHAPACCVAIDGLTIRSGAICAWRLGVRTVQTLTLHALNPARPDRKLALSELDWMARIVWASQ